MRGFLVVNCQSALVWLALRSCSQAAISSMRICLLGMRRSRHWDVRTPSSEASRLSRNDLAVELAPSRNRDPSTKTSESSLEYQGRSRVEIGSIQYRKGIRRFLPKRQQFL